MADYIERAPLMGALTSSEAQAAIRAMTGDEAYAYFLGLVNSAPAVRITEVQHELHSFWECYETSAYGGCKDGAVRWLPRKFYRCERCRKGSAIKSNYCPDCGARMEPTP